MMTNLFFIRDVRRHSGQLPTDSLGNQRHEDVVSVFTIFAGATNLLKKTLTVRLYLADKAVGAKGFKAIWTEIKVNFVRREKCYT